MPDIHDSFVTGRPRFSDQRQHELAETGHIEQAWREQLSDDPLAGLFKVQGDFAICLREPHGRTLLAVDRFAIQSLCYRIEGGKIDVATRADELAGPNPDIDLQSIFDYLYFHVIPSPRTIFRGVFRLPPGHCAVFEHGMLSVQPYWSATFPEARGGSFDALKDEFQTLLRQAVQRQLDGSKVACFLSGGTDSSTISGMSALVSGRTSHTYSIGFDAQGYDEMEFARLTARHFKTDHHEYYVTPDDLVRSIPAVAGSYDQPFGNSSALPAYYCAKMAREDGVTRILAGDGGDELFGGNTRYAKQRLFGWYDDIPAIARKALLEPAAASGLLQRVPLVKKGASYVNQAKVPMPDRMMTYNLLLHLGVHEVLTAPFLAEVRQDDPVVQQRTTWQVSAGSLVNRMLAFDWRYTLAECDLPKVVGTTRLAGLSVGFPMLDEDLVAFSQRLPTDYKLKGLQLRWFFKEALRGFLPDDTITKKKQGFGLPFGVWTTNHAPLKALASDALRSLGDRGIVRPDFIRSLLDYRLAEHSGYYGEMVWILMMLEQWFQVKAPSFRLPR